MIDELHNKDLFYKENDTFIKYFCQRIRTENELTREIQLSRMVRKFYQKVFNKEQNIINRDIFDYDFFNYGYIEDYGYYTINDGGNGYYTVTCYEEDINKAFINICQSIIDKNAKYEEKKNHREIKKIYKNRYGKSKNYQELFLTNYALAKWNEYYDGSIPEEIVDMYLNRLNINENNKLDYDLSNEELIVNQKAKTRKLKK